MTCLGERPLIWRNRPSRRLHTQRPPHAPLVTTRTTEHPALIPHEVPAGARRRTAIPARPSMKRPARAGNPRLSPPRAEATRPACHAGGRGFESRRSRKNRCKLAYCVVGSGARTEPTTQTFSRDEFKATKTAKSRVRVTPFKPFHAGL